MTPEQLRDDLSNRLSHLLGQYTHAGGTSPAIWSGNPPSSYVATGLEVLVEGNPHLSGRPQFNRAVSITRTLEVRLIDWGDTNALTEATARILKGYPQAAVSYVPASEALGISAQAVIRITP